MATNEIESNETTPANVDEDTPVRQLDQGADFSLIDVFREELKELAEAKTVMIPVKGYERIGLQVKYTMPEHGKLLDDLARRAAREFKDQYARNLYTAIDTMTNLCDGIFVQPPGEVEPVPFDPENTGEPCYFDQTLAETMGMDGTSGSARDVVRRLFGNNDMAILYHAERLSRWLQNTKADLNAEIWQLGE